MKSTRTLAVTLVALIFMGCADGDAFDPSEAETESVANPINPVVPCHAGLFEIHFADGSRQCYANAGNAISDASTLRSVIKIIPGNNAGYYEWEADPAYGYNPRTNINYFTRYGAPHTGFSPGVGIRYLRIW